MIFLVQFGINKHLYIFQRPQSALALRARALLLYFEKFTRAYLFQIALEVMWLPILISTTKQSRFVSKQGHRQPLIHSTWWSVARAVHPAPLKLRVLGHRQK